MSNHHLRNKELTLNDKDENKIYDPKKRQRGIRTERGDLNREIEVTNKHLRQEQREQPRRAQDMER